MSERSADVLAFAERVMDQPLTPWQKWLIEMAFADQDQPAIWVALPVRSVRAGDMIRMPGKQGSERRVMLVSPVFSWHVHPAANPYRPNESRAEWSEVKVTFMGVAEPFSMKPDFEVELQTTQAEADAVALLGGWESRP